MEPPEKQQKLNDHSAKPRRKRPKLRKLKTLNEQPVFVKKLPVAKMTTVIIIMSLSLLMWQKQFVSNLMDQYTKNYNMIIYGDEDYCIQKFDANTAIQLMRINLVGQDDAIYAMEGILKNHTNFSSILLAGGVGVGKTRSLTIHSKSFQWQDNVFSFYAQGSSSHESQLNLVMKLTDKLSKCGHNLILIDGMLEHNIRLMLEINDMLQSLSHEFKIIVMYAFTIPRYSQQQKDNFEDKMTSLLAIRNSIRFNQLNQLHLKKCIETEAANINAILTDDIVEAVVKSVDVLTFGCKNVKSKILLYV